MPENELPHRPRGSDEPDEDEDEIDESGYRTVKDAVLFAIEVSDSMLTASQSSSKKDEASSPTVAALKCAYHLMQQRIISNPKDMMGILIYGTQASRFYGEEENKRGGLSYPHCYLLTDLDVPAAEDVKALKTLVEDDDESTKLLIPTKKVVSMANVLFCANQIFTTKAPNFSSRRLFIVTDNDDPHADEKALRSSAAVRAKDLYDLGVTIELFPISAPTVEFDTKKFYDDIIYRTSPTDPEAPAFLPTPAIQASTSGDGISLLQSLLSNINSKAVARRALFSSVPLEIGPNFSISVKGFVIFKRQEPARACYIYLGSEKPQIAKGVTAQVADDTARTIEKWEVRKAYKFGGESVYFTPEEITQLKNFGDPIIRIIGFKPLAMLPIWASIKQAYFLYPSEVDYVGSTRVFSALYQKMLKDQLMAVTWFIARRNTTPVIAALMPGVEKTDDERRQILPPGLWIVQLPFADDIRQNPPSMLVRAGDELVDCMRTVMQQLQLPKGVYDPMRYPNPALQWHYRILQALALDEDLPDKPEDKTIPKYRAIHKRVGDDVLTWSQELDKAYRAYHTEHAPHPGKSSKRQGSEDTAGSSKRIKMEDVPPDEEIYEHAEQATLSKLTVAQLRAWLTKKGDPAAGRKADLVEATRKLCQR